MRLFGTVRRFATSLIITVSLTMLIGLAAPVSGADIYVNRTADLYNGNCFVQCSLRDAILVSNANGEDDTIHVPAGHYTLSIPGTGEDAGLTGDLDIGSGYHVTIVGEGPGVTVIDGNAIDRVLHIKTSSETVILQGLTITGGSINSSGGGIFNWNTTLIINSCEITGNHITGNNNEQRGGGIFHQEGPLWMNDSMVSYNSSDYHAGGLYLGTSSTTQLNRCTLNNNSADIAGAVHTRGESYFYNVTFFENTAVNDVGGVWVEGSSTFTHCSLYHGTDPADEAIFCRIPGALATLKNSIILGACNVEEANIDPLAGNVEWADTCFMGYGNYPDAGLSTGLVHLSDFGFNGGGVPTFKLSASGVADDYVFTDTYLLDEDARSSFRPVGPYGDSGAYELVPNEIFSHGFENRYTTGWSTTVQ